MAFDFSKLNFFNRLDARARVGVLFGGIIGVGVLAYVLVSTFSDGSSALGPSRVTNAPQGLQSVPGGANLRPEYQRVLQQANKQLAQSAAMTGGSAVPTLLNVGSQTGTSNCNIICSDESVNVKSTLDDWVSKGKISADVAKQLQDSANKNVSVAEYSAQLDQLVKDGKITPEQARELLEQYKKQAKNAALQESAQYMDDLIKSGNLPLSVANDLLTMQKNGATPTEYAAKLQQLVREGKITPEVAQQLLSQYAQQRANDLTKEGIANLRQMVSHGELVPDVAKNLEDLQGKNVSVAEYEEALNKHIQDGKLVPSVAAKLLEQYKTQKGGVGPSESISHLVQQAEQAAYGELSDLLQAGKITQEVADQLRGMIDKSVPFNEFVAAINQLVQSGKLTPEIAKLKIADYQAVFGLRAMSQKLAALQGNNASPNDYAAALKDAVAKKLITPDQAAELMRQYAAVSSQGIAQTTAIEGGSKEFADLQRRAQQAVGADAVATDDQFANVAVTGDTTGMNPQDMQLQQQRIQTMVGAMAAQAGQLVNAWQPDTQLYRAGEEPKTAAEKTQSGDNASGSTTTTTTKTTTPAGPTLIKAGTIIFAVLDTAVNSDYPDSPVLATIVDGPYKGSKLLGKLTTTKGVSGQLDRVSLNFTLMNKDEWDKAKTVTAYAIDPDTARSVLASNVDYHYLQRFGAIMATSFVQGYANAISMSSSTTTTGIFGTSATRPELSPSQKMATAIGQMGQTLGQATQNYINIPPTVKVDSGVGLGILFMSDVT